MLIDNRGYNLSFKQFYKEYIWLFIVAILVPIFVIGSYCLVYKDCCLDESIWATILSGLISYFGTIAWGIFIFYDSWQRKVEQEYKNRPMVRIHAKLSDREPYNYRMYEREEVSALLNDNICIYQLNTNYDKSHVIKYICLRVINYGQAIISDLTIVDIDIIKDKLRRNQGDYGYISSPCLAQTLSYKDEWNIYVAVDETIFNELPEGYKSIEVYLRFNHDILNTYMAKVTIHTAGIGTYGQNFKIYNPDKLGMTKPPYKYY